MEGDVKEDQQQEQQGSGNAENVQNVEEPGNARGEQKAKLSSLDDDITNDIARQTGIDPQEVADVQLSGALSGREDPAGENGNRLENNGSNQGTEKF